MQHSKFKHSHTPDEQEPAIPVRGNKGSRMAAILGPRVRLWHSQTSWLTGDWFETQPRAALGNSSRSLLAGEEKRIRCKLSRVLGNSTHTLTKFVRGVNSSRSNSFYSRWTHYNYATGDDDPSTAVVVVVAVAVAVAVPETTSYSSNIVAAILLACEQE